jgi:hypothetical protein
MKHSVDIGKLLLKVRNSVHFLLLLMFIRSNDFLAKPPNELRIDAARRAKVRGRHPRAAASIGVERSRAQAGPGSGFGI